MKTIPFLPLRAPDFNLSKMLVYEVKNQMHLEYLEGGSETVFRPVSVPRAGCLIVAVVEEAEPQL